MIGLLVSCSETSRYRVLSFIFDGVPAPEGMEVKEEGSRESEQTAFQQAVEELGVEKNPPPPQIQSIHEPYLGRNCRVCHDSPLNLDVIPRNAELCDRCHLQQRIVEGWDHGPINLGSCVPCHVPHSSIYPNLLSKPVPDVCLFCHQEEEEHPEYHAVPNYSSCTECHDPHRMY
jgi:predicted CXXCH cytochrome family protein